MLSSLLIDYPFIGISRDSVLALLGPPPPPAFNNADLQLRYPIGPSGGPLTGVTDWLVINLNADQTVGTYDLTTDGS